MMRIAAQAHVAVMELEGSTRTGTSEVMSVGEPSGGHWQGENGGLLKTTPVYGSAND